MIPRLINIADKREEYLNFSKVHLFNNGGEFQSKIKDKELTSFINKQLEEKQDFFFIRSPEKIEIFILVKDDTDEWNLLEKVRRKAAKAYKLLKSCKVDKIAILGDKTQFEIAFSEGLILSGYKFENYKSESETYSLNEIHLGFDAESSGLTKLLEGVFWSRDLVNEPPAELTARELSTRFEKLGNQSEIEVEVFGKSRIESLRMGGLLAVNRGSVQEPTFNILTYKPQNAKNKRPIVLVGKGVVYDTGGINLKPTGFLETMKSDMSGSAVVSGLIKSVAANQLPVYMIAIIPATDNRPGQDAIVPGDIITMYDGKTVEIINTDAEGRLVLADGLAFAEKYNPQLVISVATLTGSAKATFGNKVIAAMGNATEQLEEIKKAGFETGERIGELPFWDDYGDEVKSTIADLKNLGGKTSGAITAGKFLENFTNSPYIHLDIAGVSFLEKEEYYRPEGGTGTGVRLLYRFIKNSIRK